MITLNRAEILCVGTELLIGDIVNTNAAFLSRRLAMLGINQYYQAVVGDNPERLSEAIRQALDRCDLLILSGGLGPTYDDLTKETAAKCFGRRLVLHQPSLDRMRAYFERRGFTMDKNNEKQAYMPEGATVLENNYGTAPGVAMTDEERGKVMILLPGPPRELEPMFREQAEPFLMPFTDHVMVSRNVNIYGIGESHVETLIRDILTQSVNPTVAPYCGEGEVRLRVTARGRTKEECAALCDTMIETLKKSPVGEGIYGTDTTLEETAIRTLAASGMTAAAAESCTGGLVAKRLTDVPGSSAVFAGGVVSYTNAVKHAALGVKNETLAAFGAVSRETAAEMARGVKERLSADVGVSVTGYAGPAQPGSDEPVGLVFVGVSGPSGESVTELHLTGTRAHIRQLASNAALWAVIGACR